MSRRVEAASWMVYQNVSYVKSGNFTIVAERILTAADDVMFSDAAIERAASKVRGDFPWFNNYRPEVVQEHVRAIVAALREDS